MSEEQVLLLFKCLADRSRLRIVQSLLREDMYVELLSQRLGLTPATISFHLKKLEEAGFFMRASGASTYYGNSTMAEGQSVAAGETLAIGTVIGVQFSNMVEDGPVNAG